MAEAQDGALSDFVSGMQQTALKNEKTGIGTARDQRMFTHYAPTSFMNRAELESIYMTSWLGNRIVSTLPEDMVKNWRRVSWDGLSEDDATTVKKFQKHEKRLHVKRQLLTGSKWARLYGGALLIPVLRSQPDEVLAEPLDYNQIEKDDLVAIHVFDRWRAAHDGSIVRDPLDPQAGMPEHYRLAESTVRLHHTRAIRLNGRQLPYFPFRANSMWDDSVLRILINNLKQYDTAVAALTTMMFQLNVDVVMQGGLRALLATKGGAAKAIERFREFAITKAFNGIALLDKDTEEFQRHPYTFSGVDKAFDKVMYDVCGAADVPFTRLFGQSPAGMNATGESDDNHYYDHVAARREEHLDDPLAQLDEFVVRSFFGRMPEGYESEWLPPRQASEAERATADKTRADTAQVLWNMGAIDEGVVAEDVHARGMFKGMTEQHVRAAKTVASARQAAGEAGDASLNSDPGTTNRPEKKAEQKQGPADDEEEEEETPPTGK